MQSQPQPAAHSAGTVETAEPTVHTGRPSIDVPDVFRLFFIETHAGDEAYSMPFFSYMVPGAEFISALWREPVPFNLSSEYGLCMAHYSGSVFLSCPFGIWSAGLSPDDVDLTDDLTEVHLSLKPLAGALDLTLSNDDGRYNSPAFTRGCDIRLRFGYRTSEGAETAGYLPIVTIDSIERTLKKGRSEVVLHALGRVRVVNHLDTGLDDTYLHLIAAQRYFFVIRCKLIRHYFCLQTLFKIRKGRNLYPP